MIGVLEGIYGNTRPTLLKQRLTLTAPVTRTTANIVRASQICVKRQAKKHSSFMMRRYGILGGVWAVRCRPLPITGRSHQVRVFKYIGRHSQKGAVVWTFRDPPPKSEDPGLTGI